MNVLENRLATTGVQDVLQNHLAYSVSPWATPSAAGGSPGDRGLPGGLRFSHIPPCRRLLAADLERGASCGHCGHPIRDYRISPIPLLAAASYTRSTSPSTQYSTSVGPSGLLKVIDVLAAVHVPTSCSAL